MAEGHKLSWAVRVYLSLLLGEESGSCALFKREEGGRLPLNWEVGVQNPRKHAPN